MRRTNAARVLENTSKAPQRREQSRSTPDVYSLFDSINGYHPWKTAVPEGFVAYPVRKLKNSKLAYFNFQLAKEMGLISERHPTRLNSKLEQKILDTFAIQIVNEFDQHIEKKKYEPHEKTHMATRYLQLQHPDKSGRTSGDGRSIWNGYLRHRGVSWDVSSRGTGVTRLAPGSVSAGRFLKTGSEKYGYGCGTADIDELFGSLIMSEVFHRQNISTERVLAIIDIGHGRGIGVRAAPCLLRPAHLFGFLKQNRYDPLKRAFDFVIDRNYQNGDWNISPSDPLRYSKATNNIALDFARNVARWEVDHIFVWLAWDGDNVLMNGGIIDYGSVRQFGLRHDKYRYDDVERFSTNLNEQRNQARALIQTFLQAANYLETGRKKHISKFKSHRLLETFDREFEGAKLNQFLYRVGLNKKQIRKARSSELVKKLYAEYLYFEKLKTKRKQEKLPDGINKPAVLNMRKFLGELPKALAKRKLKPMSPKVLFSSMKSESASSRDLKFRRDFGPKLLKLQKLYIELLESLPGTALENAKTFARRSQVINRLDRITGNSVDIGVKEILSWKKKGVRSDQIQAIIEAFIEDQVLVPEEDRPESVPTAVKLPVINRYLNALATIAYEYMEDV